MSLDRPSDDKVRDEVADRFRALQKGTLDYVVPKEVLEEDLISEAEAREAREIAFSERALRERLGSHRYAVTLISLDERGLYDEKSAGCEGPRSCAVVSLVDYTAAETIDVRVHLERREVMDIAASPGVLTFVGEEEGQRAYGMAISYPPIAAELSGRSFWLWGPPDPGERRGGPCAPDRKHRCVLVLIKAPPDLMEVLVDLTAKRIDYWGWEYDWFNRPSEP